MQAPGRHVVVTRGAPLASVIGLVADGDAQELLAQFFTKAVPWLLDIDGQAVEIAILGFTRCARDLLKRGACRDGYLDMTGAARGLIVLVTTDEIIAVTPSPLAAVAA